VKKIVVTGSCGFIGYNLINFFDENTHIVGIDSMNDAYDNRFKTHRLQNLKKLNNFEFHEINLSETEVIKNNLQIFEGSEKIYHLGARAGVRQSFLEPEDYLMDNTLASTNVSLTVKELGIPELIIASTSSIYGDTGNNLATENTDELQNPPSVYAATKSFGEILSNNILEETETIIKIARFFTVYGPYGRPDMSILRFIHWIASEEEVIIYGDGNQKRSFTFVEDIVNGLSKLSEFERSGTFNFGSNKTYSLNEVINLIEKNLNKEANIINKERAYKDVDIVLPNLKNSKELLGWEPNTNIEDGIKKTVEWYKDNELTLREMKFKYDYE
tara:strand:+ start:4996 stop:5985 length:990 start_codon:yes stop_codon:yes gene_type:complete